MLWSAAIEKGYSSAVWMTFKQALATGAHVRKGEQGTLVVYADKLIRKETHEASGEEIERAIPFIKGYTVFNVEQIEGLPEHYYNRPALPADPASPIEHAERFFAATGAIVVHGDRDACYSPAADRILLPCIEEFRDAPSYYATRAHETIHWTRHETRLDRLFGPARFGDKSYAMEELVAELGAVFLCADLGLTPQVREDHAAYIASWIKLLKSDKRAIFTAASHASRAAGYLHGFHASEGEPAQTDRLAEDCKEAAIHAREVSPA